MSARTRYWPAAGTCALVASANDAGRAGAPATGAAAVGVPPHATSEMPNTRRVGVAAFGTPSRASATARPFVSNTPVAAAVLFTLILVLGRFCADLRRSAGVAAATRLS